jgi:hypothetical protein
MKSDVQAPASEDKSMTVAFDILRKRDHVVKRLQSRPLAEFHVTRKKQSVNAAKIW